MRSTSRSALQPRGDLGAQPRDRVRQFRAAAGRLAKPERQRRRLAARVFHAHHAAFDPEDAVRDIAELKDVAGQAFDGEVLVDRTDRLVLRLQQDLVIRGIRNGAAGGQRGQPRAAPAAQPVIDRIVMNERATPAATRGEAVGEHAHESRNNPRASARGRATPGETPRTVRRRSTPAPRLPPRSVARAHPTADRGPSTRRVRRGERCRAAPRIRPVRRASAETAVPSAFLPPRGPNARRVAGSAAIERGEPSWQTRSTSPISMPSSSEAVATSTFKAPRLSRCSASSRSSLAMLPWWAVTCSSPRRSDNCRATRSAIRRVLTKTSVVRCSCASAAIRS